MATFQPLNLFVSAGEASGDIYGAEILDRLKSLTAITEARIPVKAWGMGGSQLQESGLEIVQDSTKLGVIGAADLFKNLFFFVGLHNRLIEQIVLRRPDVALLIDYPGLNMRLAAAIRKHVPSCRIVYFVAPQVWAWNESRVNKLPAIVDRLLTILPFEEPLHRRAGTSARYVGNPSAWLMQNIGELKREAVLEYCGLPANTETLITIFPGSRDREVTFLLPTMLQAAQRLKMRLSNIEFAIVRAPTIQASTIQAYINKAGCGFVHLVEPDKGNLLKKISNICWAKSGTTTLEAACAQCPTIICYRENPIFWFVFDRFIRKVPFIGLPNIVAGRAILPELLQDDCSPENIVAITEDWLVSAEATENVCARLKAEILDILCAEVADPFDAVAQEVLNLFKVSVLSRQNSVYMQEKAAINSEETNSNSRTTLSLGDLLDR